MNQVKAMWAQASSLARAGFVWIVGFGVLATAWVVAEMLTDPGGLAGIGMSAGLLVPLLALCFVAVRLPEHARLVLEGAVAVVVVIAVLQALDVQLFGDGPVVSVAVLAVAVPLAFLGLREPRAAGWLLLVAGVLPIAERMVHSVAAGDPIGAGLGGSAGVVALPVLIGGLCFLLASRSQALPSGKPPSSSTTEHFV